MRRLPVFLCLLAIPLSAAPVATASTVFKGSDGITVDGGTDAMDVEVHSPALGQLVIQDFSPADDLAVATFGSAAADCVESPAETITCSNFDATKQYAVQLQGGTAADTLEAKETGLAFPTLITGGGGADVLLGGAGYDTLYGGLGSDDLDGRGGGDFVDNGYDDSRVRTSSDGADLYRDTGTSGSDYLSFRGGTSPGGVRMSVNGAADDGSIAENEGDDIRAGFDFLQGGEFGDVIVGGPAAETINGSQGNDDITGGGGADTIEGNEGEDTIRARDGEVDTRLDCDSASSSSFGVAETAFVDAADPEPSRCETIDRLGGGPAPTPTPAPGTTPAPTPTPGPGETPGPTPGPGETPAPTLAPAPATPAPLAVPDLTAGTVNATEVVSRMPRVTGKKFAAARDEVLKTIAFATVDIEFKRGCKQGDFLEVTKQTPITGTSLAHDSRSPVAVALVACIADADYLRDCDLASVRSDVARLGSKALDADVALTVLGSVNRCKVDYDVKLSKAAEEARIKLEAQKASDALAKADRDKADAKKQAADKIKSDLRSLITCPLGGDLRVAVTDGYAGDRRALGLKGGSGNDAWTLPSHPRAAYLSYVELAVIDRGFQFPEATVFLDTDDVKDFKEFGKKARTTTKNGRAVFSVRPEKPGKLRICVMQETGGDQVLSAGIEITVGGQPATNSVYETVAGRQIKLTPNGPVPLESSAARASAGQATATRANLLGDIWDAIVKVFDGRSRTVNAEASGSSEKRIRTEKAANVAKIGAGQLSLTGTLVPNPQVPVLNRNGSCFASAPNGDFRLLTCQTLDAPSGNALIGMSNDGTGKIAMGNGNVVGSVPGNTLIGQDGASLIGQDGASLIGQDGASIISRDGAGILSHNGGLIISRDGAGVIAANRGDAIAIAPSQLVSPGGSNFAGQASGLVNAGGLN